jgi:hypothetical protein
MVDLLNALCTLQLLKLFEPLSQRLFWLLLQFLRFLFFTLLMKSLSLFLPLRLLVINGTGLMNFWIQKLLLAFTTTRLQMALKDQTFLKPMVQVPLIVIDCQKKILQLERVFLPFVFLLLTTTSFFLLKDIFALESLLPMFFTAGRFQALVLSLMLARVALAKLLSLLSVRVFTMDNAAKFVGLTTDSDQLVLLEENSFQDSNQPLLMLNLFLLPLRLRRLNNFFASCFLKNAFIGEVAEWSNAPGCNPGEVSSTLVRI